MPLLMVFQWMSGLLSIVTVGAGGYLIYDWYRERREAFDLLEELGRAETFRWTDGIEPLLFGIALLALAVLGRPLVLFFAGRSGDDEPCDLRADEVRRVTATDGTELHVELYGPADGIPLLMTHGWGLDSTAWYYAKRDLSLHYRLIVWDLPGLGRSSEPPDKAYTIEKFAEYLAQLLPLAGNRPVFLLGRLFPESLEARVQGLIFVHTTYTNAAATTFLKAFLHAIQVPILIPMMYLTIALSPLVRIANWLSYWNGSLHLATAYTGFAGTQTRAQLDFMTKFTPRASPAVQARGNLATFQFDERAHLPHIRTPTLVIVADRDRTTIPEAGNTLAGLIPTAERVVLSPANHSGFLERHDEFAEIVHRFIASTATQA
jgi:pimeloyl-ACP methyl ester carboxylesterase